MTNKDLPTLEQHRREQATRVERATAETLRNGPKLPGESPLAKEVEADVIRQIRLSDPRRGK